MTALEVNQKYKVKGTIIKNFQLYISRRVSPDFFKDILSESGLGTIRGILSSSWYPAEKHIKMLELAADEVNQNVWDMNTEFAREWLENDMNGVYRFFMRIGQPVRVFSRMNQIDKGYANYGNAQVIKNEFGEWVGTFIMPQILEDWHMSSVRGGVVGILKVCGYKINSFEILDRKVDDLDGDLMQTVRAKITY